MRQLILHASALNDVEYDLYTSSLNDLAWTDNVDQTSTHDDVYYEKMKLGVREARGWLRGRYSHVAPADIDIILRFFSPELSQTDTLSGGQFFAALRLVVHVDNGKEVDRGLAFVQAQPKTETDVSSPSRQPQPDLPPPTPVRRTHTEDTNPFSLTNPVSPPPFHPLSRHDVAKSQPIPHSTHNPFVNRSTKPTSNDHPVKGPPLPPRKHAPTVAAHSILLPPPRHSSILLPPTDRKSVSPTRALTPGSATLVPVNPAPGLPIQSSSGKASHVTSNLMKQSLQASKAGQTMKKAEELLEQERVMQVLKSSSVVSGTNIRNRSSSPTKFVYPPSAGNTSSSSRSDEWAPPLPRRRTQQQQPSPPVSISSLEEVAFAAANSRQGSQYQNPAPPSTGGFHGPRPIPTTYNNYTSSTASRELPEIPHGRGHLSTASPFYSSPSSSPSRPSVDLPQPPCQPPTHPDRKQSYFPYQAPTNFSSSSTTSSRTSDTHVNNQIGPSGPFSGSNYGSTPAGYGSSNSMQQNSPFRNTNPSTPEGSPSARVFRSKSMHHPSPPLPPIPPPIRRKRPESVQVLGSGEIIFGGKPSQSGSDSVSPFSSNDGRRPGSNLSRHTSLSSPGASAHRRSSLSMSSTTSAHSQPQPGYDANASPMSNIQRTIATLQPKLDGLGLQPRFEKARYKAEAGISRRGFVKDRPRSGSKGSNGRGGLEGEEKEDLIGGSGDSDEAGRRRRVYGYDRPSVDVAKPGQELDDGEMDSDETGDGPGDGDGEREWRRATRERWGGQEMDELKWPAGDGWKPL